jgi:hypothetical protein
LKRTKLEVPEEHFSHPRPPALQLTNPLAKAIVQLEKAAVMDSVVEKQATSYNPNFLRTLAEKTDKTEEEKRQLRDGLEAYTKYKRRLDTVIHRRKALRDMLCASIADQDLLIRRAQTSMLTCQELFSQLTGKPTESSIARMRENLNIATHSNSSCWSDAGLLGALSDDEFDECVENRRRNRRYLTPAAAAAAVAAATASRSGSSGGGGGGGGTGSGSSHGHSHSRSRSRSRSRSPSPLRTMRVSPVPSMIANALNGGCSPSSSVVNANATSGDNGRAISPPLRPEPTADFVEHGSGTMPRSPSTFTPMATVSPHGSPRPAYMVGSTSLSRAIPSIPGSTSSNATTTAVMTSPLRSPSSPRPFQQSVTSGATSTIAVATGSNSYHGQTGAGTLSGVRRVPPHHHHHHHHHHHPRRQRSSSSGSRSNSRPPSRSPSPKRHPDRVSTRVNKSSRKK